MQGATLLQDITVIAGTRGSSKWPPLQLVAAMFFYIVTIAVLKWIFVKQVVERWPRLN
jgi:hypothetical protein